MDNLPWHIPKRSSLLQVIGSLHIIKKLGLDGKKWSKGNAKKYNQSLGTWGLTTKGGSLSSTARETLEALIKFLGFFYIDEEHKIHITPAGHKLIEEFSSFKKPNKPITLTESKKLFNFTKSVVVKNQLVKLVISNPAIKERLLGKNTSVKPFIETLKYLIDEEVNYLSREEMAMFVFFQEKPEDYKNIKKSILDFRKLSDIIQRKKAEEFAKSYIGNKIYGESSATVKYWEAIVKTSGLIDRGKIGFYLNNSKSEVKGIINSYESPNPNLFDEEKLWWEYYGNYKILRYPRKLNYHFPNLRDFKLLLTYKPATKVFLNYFTPKLKVDGDSHVEVIVFPDVNYDFNLKVLIDDSGKFRDIKFTNKFTFTRDEYTKESKNDCKVLTTSPKQAFFKDELKEMLTNNKISSKYINSIAQLLILLGEVKNRSQAMEYIKKRKALIKGGRFEKLFYELLLEKEKLKIIDKVIEWRGREKYGIYYPSLAGKGFETDIEFRVNNYYFGLELTTAMGRQQWKSEAESVTDHIRNLKANLETKRKKYHVVGIFTAPKITEFMQAICFYFSKIIYKVPILAIESREFFEIFETSKNNNQFIKKINKHCRRLLNINLK